MIPGAVNKTWVEPYSLRELGTADPADGSCATPSCAAVWGDALMEVSLPPQPPAPQGLSSDFSWAQRRLRVVVSSAERLV